MEPYWINDQLWNAQITLIILKITERQRFVLKKQEKLYIKEHINNYL